MDCFYNKDGFEITLNLIKTIKQNKQHLSDVDGQIGDGDHGINMYKGCAAAEERIRETNNFSESLEILGNVLLNEIGGAMGPLYGYFFLTLSRNCKGVEKIGTATFSIMLQNGLRKIKLLGDAEVGDKTLVDTLNPAVLTFESAINTGKSFCPALDEMKEAAIKGRDSTRDLAARKGRASRLGDRSIGALDPGAESCYLILVSMADTIKSLINANEE